MMRKSKKRYLKTKGFRYPVRGKKEIEHKIKAIREERKERKKRKKKKKIIFLDKIVYWIALFIAIMGNMLIAISLIPFLLTLSEVLLYVVIAIMGLAFGLFFEILVRDIENMEKKHHIVISILIPSIAVISFFVITIVANNLKTLLGLGVITHKPLMVGTTYTIAFILPYAVYHLILKRKK
jgi:cation transport ATPase